MANNLDLFSPIPERADEIVDALRRDGRDVEEEEIVAGALDEVRRFCSRQVDSAAIDERGRLGDELLQQVAERGWFGLTVPEAYGGTGLSLQAACRVVSELASFNGSLGTCVGLHSGLGLYSLIHLATDDLRSRYLGEIATGQRIASFAVTEPGAGSDLAAMQSTLRESDGELRLSGSKCFVTNGGICGVLTTVARSPGLGGARAGHTVVVVDPNWPGVVRHVEERKLGLKGSSTVTITFDNVLVPADHVVGTQSLGLEYAHNALTWGRTFMAAGCVGAALAAIAQTEEYVRTREQFRRPLIGFALVRGHLGGALADVYSMESVIRLVCYGFDAALFDIALPSTAAKVFVSERAWEVVDTCIQLHGGMGYIEDVNLARKLRDLRVTRIFEGSNDVLRLHLTSAALGWASDPTNRCRLLEEVVSPTLSPSAARVDRLIAQVLETITIVRKQYGFRLFERQVLQSYLADALIEAYAASAVALRASGADPKCPAGAREVATAELAIERAVERAERALIAASGPACDARQVMVDRLFEGQN